LDRLFEYAGIHQILMMHRLFQFAVLLAALSASLALALSSAQVVDRVVAAVNGEPILQSDWDDAMRYQCFIDQRPLQGFTVADMQAAFDRLIDTTLLRQQMRLAKFEESSPVAAAAQAAELRRQRSTAAVGDPQENWTLGLQRCGLTEQEVEDRLAEQTGILNFIDQRFRQNIHIDYAAVVRYYQESLVPELQRSGVKAGPLTGVEPRIREILIQQAVNQMLATWLQNLRQESVIEVR
jgi:peptidyl-prolyl cis-trans isomerase SurA